MVSITTLDYNAGDEDGTARSSPARRLAAVRGIADAGIPVGVMAADDSRPERPGDARDIGGCGRKESGTAGYTSLRLPFAVKDLFANWLTRHFPIGRKKC